MEMALGYFEALFFYLLSRTENNRIKPQDRRSRNRDLNAGSFKQATEVQPIHVASLEDMSDRTSLVPVTSQQCFESVNVSKSYMEQVLFNYAVL
jgi:hypothetical protein